MLTSKRKLLFLLSLELLLLSLLYVPLLILAALAAHGSSGLSGDITLFTLVFGLPLTVALTDAWIAGSLIVRGLRDKAARPTMWFGLGCMTVQLAIITGSIFVVDVAVPWSVVIAFVGLVVAAFMKRDAAPAPPSPAEQTSTPILP